jgi:hypothetical protein
MRLGGLSRSWLKLIGGGQEVPGLLAEPNWYRKVSGSVVACKPKLSTTSSAFVIWKPEMQFVVFFVVPSQANCNSCRPRRRLLRHIILRPVKSCGLRQGHPQRVSGDCARSLRFFSHFSEDRKPLDWQCLQPYSWRVSSRLDSGLSACCCLGCSSRLAAAVVS